VAAAGVSTIVRTTRAGFRSTPRYQAHVMGKRTYTFTSGAQQIAAAVDGYVHIANPTPVSFELRVVLPGGIFAAAGTEYMLNGDNVLMPAFMDRLQRELEWHVVWLGVEG
jgi:hypothetical protein